MRSMPSRLKSQRAATAMRTVGGSYIALVEFAMASSNREMRKHSVGLFLGAVFCMLGLPMTILAYQSWSLALGYVAVAAMLVASIGFGIRGMETKRDAIWLGGRIVLFFLAVYMYCLVWLSEFPPPSSANTAWPQGGVTVSNSIRMDLVN